MGLEDIKKLLKEKTIVPRGENETSPTVSSVPKIAVSTSESTVEQEKRRTTTTSTIVIPPQLEQVKKIMERVCSLTETNRVWCKYIVNSVNNGWKSPLPSYPPSPEIIDILTQISPMIPDRVRKLLEETFGITLMHRKQYDKIAEELAKRFVSLANQTLNKLENIRNQKRIIRELRKMKMELDRIKELPPTAKEQVLRQLTSVLNKPRETVINRIENINKIVRKQVMHKQHLSELKQELSGLLGRPATTMTVATGKQPLEQQVKSLKQSTAQITDKSTLPKRLKSKIKLVS